MRFWPSDSFEIDTTLSREDIITHLNSSVQPGKPFRFFPSSAGHKNFRGQISQDGFKISRTIDYANSFLSVITDRFLPGQSGTKVAVHMSLHPFVGGFMYVWFGGIGLGFVVTMFGLFSGRVAAFPIVLIPSAMLVFGWALASGCFWFEARRQKPVLIQMFRAWETSQG
ncbi:MAG: hypothetical protein JW993_04175 [Sedimentisphaerales bacterium]|nr:hypothetical protein [Sedimentisphaerales bacterium]